MSEALRRNHRLRKVASVGDIIVKFDGQSVTSGDDLLEKLQYYKSGEKIEAVVARATDGEYQESTVEITLGSRSENS